MKKLILTAACAAMLSGCAATAPRLDGAGGTTTVSTQDRQAFCEANPGACAAGFVAAAVILIWLLNDDDSPVRGGPQATIQGAG